MTDNCVVELHISRVSNFPRKKGKNMKFPLEKGKKTGKFCHWKKGKIELYGQFLGPKMLYKHK